jgi:hypothetical protein
MRAEAKGPMSVRERTCARKEQEALGRATCLDLVGGAIPLVELGNELAARELHLIVEGLGVRV